MEACRFVSVAATIPVAVEHAAVCEMKLQPLAMVNGSREPWQPMWQAFDGFQLEIERPRRVGQTLRQFSLAARVHVLAIQADDDAPRNHAASLGLPTRPHQANNHAATLFVILAKIDAQWSLAKLDRRDDHVLGRCGVGVPRLNLRCWCESRHIYTLSTMRLVPRPSPRRAKDAQRLQKMVRQRCSQMIYFFLATLALGQDPINREVAEAHSKIRSNHFNTTKFESIFAFSKPFPIPQPARQYGEHNCENHWTCIDLWLKAVLDYGYAHKRNTADNKFMYIINIGAHYGRGIDDIVSYAMQSDHLHGFAVDSDQRMNWAGRHIQTHTGYVTPLNVGALMAGARVPDEPLLLKVDIDSYDVDVAIAVLQQYSPMFIFVELNEKVPPPMCYCNRFSAQWRRVDGDAYGCSLTGFVNAFSARGYVLLSVILNDALFIRSDQVEKVAPQLPAGKLMTTQEAYYSGYANVPYRRHLFPWNEKRKSWIDPILDHDSRARLVHDFFLQNGGGEALGFTYPFVSNATDGVWPCVEKKGHKHKHMHARESVA